MPAKHTTQPWVNNGHGMVVCQQSDICEILSINVEADGNLIAAAPDMKELLFKIRAALSHVGMTRSLGTTDTAMIGQQIDDILRKAGAL